MQNAANHVGDSTAVHIIVAERDDSLCFDVHDSGAAPAGVSLTNIRDRVAAVRGHVSIESAPGRGTRISAAIPLTPPA
jgi:signal transduction histidine kinase